MFIISIEGKEEEGAYAVTNEEGEQVLYLFQEEDDAVRFAMMLEDSGYPEMHVMEVEDEIIIEACETHDYNYAIITKDDIVIPPEKTEEHDFI